MRDAVTGFYVEVLRRLLAENTISTADRVLVVCGGPLDETVFRETGFRNVTVTGIDREGELRQDAESLTYGDGAFDVVVVHAGLHHCYSPHRALLEMYRVARKCALAFESRDSLLMRSAVRLGLTLDYEVNSVVDGKGGVADTGTPNFVYRWTEREVIKTVASYDPKRPPTVQFYYDMRLPIQRFSRSGQAVLRAIATAIEPLSRVFARIAPKQCNEFAFAVTKRSEPHPWIK
ncbi:class I SAM-dependent methyltransferase [Bradyrhizobium sp. sGM-13]|uniref:class I SAM-dependent methyltransferase n=1 Tax=Bradyrhizobium sp. sGM-13 TaxID=2831781 RepID=UPI001BCD5798|nr:methyltransferase domain-containing protein [Bradyrhizobium sp. sGM-13]